MFKKLLLVFSLLTTLGLQAHYTNYLEEDYLVLKKKKKAPWGSKYIKSFVYGASLGASVGAVCGHFDKTAIWYHIPLHWCAALVVRKVGGEIIIEQEEETGSAMSRTIFFDTSLVTSWAAWAYLMFGYKK